MGKRARNLSGPGVLLPRYERAIRHVYKVLLTRGMRGTVIYSPDRQTREILRDLLSEQAEAEVDQ